MSNILVDRCVAHAASRIVLGERVFYLNDPTHPDHSGAKKKTIHPARNYNTTENDQSPEGFIAAIVRLDQDYLVNRRGKTGKRSRRLFEEIIYSTEAGAWLSQNERDVIERRIVSRFASMAICRTAWHEDEKNGRSDLHVLFSAKNLDYPTSMTLWSEFGGADNDHLYAVMDRLDGEITQYLNRAPERKKTMLMSANQRHQKAASLAIGKQVRLAEELARYFLNRKKPADINSEAIVTAIESLGHQVIAPAGRSLSVRFRGRKKPRRYNLTSLKDEMIVALEKIRTDNPGSLG